MLYIIAGLIGFILAKLLAPPPVSPFFQDVVMRNIKLGKRVVICVDTEATIFEMIEDKIRITRGTSDFFMETPDVDVLASATDTESDIVDKDMH